MGTTIFNWLLKFGLERLISFVVSFFIKKKKHKAIDKKEETIARSVNAIVTEIYALEDLITEVASEEERDMLKGKINELENELRIVTRYRDGS